MPIAAARTLAIGARAVVRGTVTVAPGWILGDLTTAIQDETAGIYVRLPQIPIEGIVPGKILQAEGVLAAPYGNLEIRPSAAGVQLMDTTSIPQPLGMTLGDLSESTEGLLAHLEGTIRRIEGSGVTSLTLILDDGTNEGRLFAHATLGVGRDDFSVGERVAVTGLVGDRLGLYRIWPRNRFDITHIQPNPTPTPTASPRPHPSPSNRPTPRPTPTRSPSTTPRPSSGPTEMSISEALRKPGQPLTVTGVATTRNGLLDADGQRITLQDASGAILVRLPEGVTAQIGQRLRVSGEVGTYYGAPQLTASAAAPAGETGVQPLQVRAAPVAAGLEWRLIVVTGTIESVHRDGVAWRAELNMTGGGIPIVGLERSGIASTVLMAGRQATVTGIAKRAYPTASDQRFAVVPRTAADIRLGSDSGGPNGSPGIAAPTGAGAGLPWLASAPPSGAQSASASSAAASMTTGSSQSVPLGELGSYLGMRVTVGGEVVAVQAGRIAIDDGTGAATVIAAGSATETVRYASIGDLLNATGVVAQAADAGFEITVEDPLALSWLDLTRSSPIPTTAGSAAPSSSASAGAGQAASLTGSGTDTRVIVFALLGLALAAGAAALMTSPNRRERLRAWLAQATQAVKQRLSALRSI